MFDVDYMLSMRQIVDANIDVHHTQKSSFLKDEKMWS